LGERRLDDAAYLVSLVALLPSEVLDSSVSALERHAQIDERFFIGAITSELTLFAL
jgi:hypothetical protein